MILLIFMLKNGGKNILQIWTSEIIQFIYFEMDLLKSKLDIFFLVFLASKELPAALEVELSLAWFLLFIFSLEQCVLWFFIYFGEYICAIVAKEMPDSSQLIILQIFILGIPPQLAATWFPSHQVSSACAIGVFGNQVSYWTRRLPNLRLLASCWKWLGLV